eukprot:CAMPEP_0182454618 /NCGR_PEP_ID=MMETSP1319-20130603/1176_1 /TAXON_ID=172717 /ORGANISM="Bolidomonas pacifica, Strain RCC208" /LENGTH=317 /DNA_ID=CAMNT_0024652639 /DNA_START=28 /DNA_END=978 /DNA_ORIENTATION=+
MAVSTRSSAKDEGTLPKGRITNNLAVTLSGIFLYICSPFFAHPPKVVANILCGAPYADAYLHFRRDHQGTLNLFLHCCILCLQVTCNFAFLEQVDVDFDVVKVAGVGLATATVAMWLALLMLTPSPLVVKAVAAPVVLAGYYVRSSVAGAAFSHLIHLQPFLDTLVYIYFVKKPLTLALYVLVFGIRLLLHYTAITHAQGILMSYLSGENGVKLALGFVAFAAFLSHKPFTKPASGVFGIGVLFGWPLAVMTVKPVVFLWASGFIATALQGVSHRETKEPPTMPHLANISNELAHSTFFPCLLLQACLAQITGSDKE